MPGISSTIKQATPARHLRINAATGIMCGAAGDHPPCGRALKAAAVSVAGVAGWSRLHRACQILLRSRSRSRSWFRATRSSQLRRSRRPRTTRAHPCARSITQADEGAACPVDAQNGRLGHSGRLVRTPYTVHEQVAAHDLCGGYAMASPGSAAGILFGAAWRRGRLGAMPYAWR